MKNLNIEVKKTPLLIVQCLTRFFLVLSSITFYSNISLAADMAGGDLSYRLIDTITGEYEVTLSYYRDCMGPNFNSETLHYQVSGGIERQKVMTLISNEEVTPLCLPPDVLFKPLTNCPGPAQRINGIKGVERKIHRTKIVLGVNKGFAAIWWTRCCRNMVTTTSTTTNFYVQAFINTNYQNNSVIFTTPPIPYWCRQRLNTYNHGAVDSFDPRYIIVNGNKVIRDSLNYVLYTPHTARALSFQDMYDLKNPSITFNPGLNKLDFLYTTKV